MKWVERRRNRVIVSYPLAVWSYGLIFAAISGVYPSTAGEILQFAFMPVLLTLQLGFYYVLKKIAGDSPK
jgi:hypothetical protein